MQVGLMRLEMGRKAVLGSESPIAIDLTDHSVPVELQRLMRFFHSYKKPASFDSALLNLDTPV